MNNLTYHNGRICEEIAPEVIWLDRDFYYDEGEVVLPWNSKQMEGRLRL